MANAGPKETVVSLVLQAEMELKDDPVCLVHPGLLVQWSREKKYQVQVVHLAWTASLECLACPALRVSAAPVDNRASVESLACRVSEARLAYKARKDDRAMLA